MNNNPHLWQNFLRGDKSALSEIFLSVHDDLFRYGLKLTGDENLVKDAIQDLFLKLWKNRSNLKPVENFNPYLFKALRHHIIDNLELQGIASPFENEQENAVSIIYSVEDFLINEQVTEETRQKVIAALNKLMPRQREVIYLRYFEGLNFETIASIMNINIQSVRNTLHRGLVALRDLILIHPFFMLVGKIAWVV